MDKYGKTIAFRANRSDVDNIDMLKAWIKKEAPSSFRVTNSDVIRYALEQLNKQVIEQGMQKK